MNSSVTAETVTCSILDEIYKALGVSTKVWFRRFLDPFLRIPVHRFAIICNGLNERIEADGIASAAEWTLPFFIKNVHYIGQNTVPHNGPLLIISNHPGAVDSVCITAGAQRDDLVIIAYEVPFYRTLPNVSAHFIYTTDDQYNRMMALRSSVRHLQNNGTLLLFATGKIDPDPTVSDYAENELEDWSLSIPIILRLVPEAQVILCIAGGLVSPRFANHPITRLRTAPMDRRRLAEFYQILSQLIFKKTYDLSPLIYFSEPILSKDILEKYPMQSLLSELIISAKTMVKNYLDYYASKNNR